MRKSDRYVSVPPGRLRLRRTDPQRLDDGDWVDERPTVYDLEVDDSPEYVETELFGPDGRKLWRRQRDPLGFL